MSANSLLVFDNYISEVYSLLKQEYDMRNMYNTHYNDYRSLQNYTFKPYWNTKDISFLVNKIRVITGGERVKLDIETQGKIDKETNEFIFEDENGIIDSSDLIDTLKQDLINISLKEEDSCNRNCLGYCSTACATSCTGTCIDGCDNTCLYGCGTTCNQFCELFCAESCQSGCNSTCSARCTRSCVINCSGGCYGGCSGLSWNGDFNGPFPIDFYMWDQYNSGLYDYI